MSAWAKFPTTWITKNKGLIEFSWQKYKSDATAALLVLVALCVKKNLDNMGLSTEARATNPNYVYATYDEIQSLVCISRSKVSKGLALLMKFEVIKRSSDHRSFYEIVGIDRIGEWAKFPQRRVMAQNRITAFETFTLRTSSELDALKLYFLIVAFRNTKTNYAHLSYNAFMQYTGVRQNKIMKAKSHLINLGLINVDFDMANSQDKSKPSMRYKVLGL